MMAGASRSRRLGVTLALMTFAAVVAVGLPYLVSRLRPIRGRGSLGQPGENAADDTSAASDQATETTPRPSAEEGPAAEQATAVVAVVAEEPLAEPLAEAEPQASPERRRRLRRLLGLATYLGVIVGAILLGPRIMAWALDADHPMAAVSSGSMWPALKEGDIVFLRGVDSAEDLKVGDIIAFRHEGGFAIHRVVDIEGQQITTQGDANRKADAPIMFDDVIGRVPTIAGRLAKVPYLGNLGMLLGTNTDEPNAQPPIGGEGTGESP